MIGLTQNGKQLKSIEPCGLSGNITWEALITLWLWMEEDFVLWYLIWVEVKCTLQHENVYLIAHTSLKMN